MSAAMVSRVDSGELPPVCLECLPGVLATAQDEYELALHPDQHEELRSLGILEYSMGLVERLNRINQKRKG